MDPETCVTDLGGLRAIYREPSKVALDKAIDHIRSGGCPSSSDIRHCSSCQPATASGTTPRPRGGPPGFVQVLDDRYLAFGDLVGNNRLDSFTNLVAHPGVGMLFMIPGLVETLRVNGTASIVTDQPLLQRCAIGGVTPKVAIRVEVDECFIHCGAALRRWFGMGHRHVAIGRRSAIGCGHREASRRVGRFARPDPGGIERVLRATRSGRSAALRSRAAG